MVKEKTVLIIFVVAIILVLLCIAIAEVVAGVMFERALKGAVENTDDCVAEPFKCEPFNSTPPPPDFSTTYSLPIAKYVGQAITNLSTDTALPNYSPATIRIPSNLTLVSTLDYNGNPIIGYIAYDSQKNILYIIYRGTQTDDEWYENFQMEQTPLTQLDGEPTFPNMPLVMVHQGFYNIFVQFQQGISVALEQYPTAAVIIAGHSLGGALASLTSNYIYALTRTVSIGSPTRDIVAYTFGKPRVGNIAYARQLDIFLPERFFRMENENDLIPTIPFSATPNRQDYNKPWIYEHEGVEIRFSKNWSSLGLNHYMTVYMTRLYEM